MKILWCCLVLLISLAISTISHVSEETAFEMVNKQQHIAGVVLEDIKNQWLQYPAVAQCLREADVESSLLAKIDELLASHSLWNCQVSRRNVKDGSLVPRCLLQSLSVAQSVDKIIGDFNALLNTPTCSELSKLEELRFISEVLVLWSGDVLIGLVEGKRTVVFPSDLDVFLYRSMQLHMRTTLFIVTARLEDFKLQKGRDRSFTRIVKAVRDIHVAMGKKDQATPQEQLEYLNSLSAKAVVVSDAIGAAVDSFDPKADEIDTLNQMKTFYSCWSVQATDLGKMAENLVDEISRTTTTTEAPVTLSIDELAALFDSHDKPVKKENKKKKQSTKQTSAVATKVEAIPPSTTTSTPRTTTAIPNLGIDDSDWLVVGKPVKKPVQRTSRSIATGSLSSDSDHVTKLEIPTTTTTTTTTTMTTATTTPTTTSTATSTTTTRTTAPTTTATDATTNAATTVTKLMNPGSTTKKMRKFGASRTGSDMRRPVDQSNQQPYLVIPLAKPSVDQMWVITTQMTQLSEQLGQLTHFALQQGNDPAVVANIEVFFQKAAYAHQILADLQLSASGLVEFVNSIPSGVFVSPSAPV